MRIYLDNCCYNRPYDDQSQTRIHLEAQAKMQIQQMIKNQEIELVTSYILEYENEKNHSLSTKQSINHFIYNYATYHIDINRDNEIVTIAEPIMLTGIKQQDAYHVACAILAECNYFITVDDRLLKYQTKEMPLITPIDFINKWRN